MALKYFEFIKRQSKPRKYLETSEYVVTGEVSSDFHLKFLNQRDDDQGFFWSKQETSRRGPSLLESKNPSSHLGYHGRPRN
jgi:hypothetical protein